MKDLQLASHPPAIVLQCEALPTNASQNGMSLCVCSSNSGSTLLPASIALSTHEDENLQVESAASTAENQRSALVIQAFFRRHRRAGGPIPTAFEDVVKKLNRATEADRPGKNLLLCLRGPLPHVLGYLKVLHEACQAKVGRLTREMQTKDHEMLDELREQKDDIRYAKDGRIFLGGIYSTECTHYTQLSSPRG